VDGAAPGAPVCWPYSPGLGRAHSVLPHWCASASQTCYNISQRWSVSLSYPCIMRLDDIIYWCIATTLSVASTFYALGSIYPPELATFISPRPGPPSPVADSPEGIARTAEVESRLQSLPIVKQLRQQTEKFYETRPFADYPEEKRVRVLFFFAALLFGLQWILD
jgi:hypothetical protein